MLTMFYVLLVSLFVKEGQFVSPTFHAGFQKWKTYYFCEKYLACIPEQQVSTQNHLGTQSR